MEKRRVQDESPALSDKIVLEDRDEHCASASFEPRVFLACPYRFSLATDLVSVVPPLERRLGVAAHVVALTSPQTIKP